MSDTGKHTDGPWIADGEGGGDYTVKDGADRVICDVAPAAGPLRSDGCRLVLDGATKANARLIAASPELLDAGQEIDLAAHLDGWDDHIDDPDNSDDVKVEISLWRLRKLRAAIAKAEGRKP
ncbi:MAG: hypothetical protein EBY40_01160 [Marivivens sp.]|nr:hypothetical protein [Marivivens sp.]NCW67388.1 hypothetical protein [Marivivens sp.]NDH01717.1 hypothetical protein [Marivivens sp.]